MTIELRCEGGRNGHFHAQFDPLRMRLLIKCRWCSKERGQDVFHEWKLAEIAAQFQDGSIIPVCHPQEPTLVRWMVSSSE